MKRLLLALCTGMVLSLYADAPARFDYQLPESVEMPGGEIYYHPKVVEVRPDGITIMHDNGAAFWPFSQLPPEIQKKFNYNPVAAQQYIDEMLLRRQKFDEMKEKQQITDANHQVYVNLVSQRYYCTSLRMKIAQLQRQIGQDTQNTQNLAAEYKQDRTDVNQEAVSSGGNSTNGFWTTNNAGTDDATRVRAMGAFADDAQKSKTDYEMWTFAKDQAQNNLAEYQQEYSDAQAKLKSLEMQWAQVQASEAKVDQSKLNQQIHQSVQQEMQKDLAELKKLREMRNQNLITVDEYIQKKAQILKRF